MWYSCDYRRIKDSSTESWGSLQLLEMGKEELFSKNNWERMASEVEKHIHTNVCHSSWVNKVFPESDYMLLQTQNVRQDKTERR